jgi:hypothetical protein
MPPSTSTLTDRAFRYRLTMMIWAAGRPVTVAELLAHLGDAGRLPRGRPSKVVSDALRWEIRRGRVRRVGRGVYVAGRMPRSTFSWIRSQIRAADAHMTHPVQRQSDNRMTS